MQPPGRADTASRPDRGRRRPADRVCGSEHSGYAVEVTTVDHPARQASTGFGMVVLAASSGGLEALTLVLAALPDSFPLPVLVVQHRRAHEPDRLATVLARRCALPVRLGEDGSLPSPGEVLVAPSQGVTLDATGALCVPFTSSSPRRRPADGLLASAARCHRDGLIAVVLTGHLDDGARGVQEVKAHGGRVLIQDPSTAAARGMPEGALATGCVDFVLSPEMLGSALVALAMAPGGARLLRVPPAPWAVLAGAVTDTRGHAASS